MIEPTPTNPPADDNVTAALARFRDGYSCSQASFSAFAEQLGLPIDTALRIASTFGGGIGRRGEVCGAATGALMALGLQHGFSVLDANAKEHATAVAAEFVRRFEARTGALRCRDLIQADMTTPEGLAEARERKVFADLCPLYVQAAVEIARELVEK